jgi:hypothetical protein
LSHLTIDIVSTSKQFNRRASIDIKTVQSQSIANPPNTPSEIQSFNDVLMNKMRGRGFDDAEPALSEY